MALTLLLLVGTSAATLAAEPAATGRVGGDPRSPGEGPGLVGDPGFALAVVVIVALLSVALTLAYVRATDQRNGGRRR